MGVKSCCRSGVRGFPLPVILLGRASLRRGFRLAIALGIVLLGLLGLTSCRVAVCTRYFAQNPLGWGNKGGLELLFSTKRYIPYPLTEIKGTNRLYSFQSSDYAENRGCQRTLLRLSAQLATKPQIAQANVTVHLGFFFCSSIEIYANTRFLHSQLFIKQPDQPFLVDQSREILPQASAQYLNFVE